ENPDLIEAVMRDWLGKVCDAPPVGPDDAVVGPTPLHRANPEALGYENLALDPNQLIDEVDHGCSKPIDSSRGMSCAGTITMRSLPTLHCRPSLLSTCVVPCGARSATMSAGSTRVKFQPKFGGGIGP